MVRIAVVGGAGGVEPPPNLADMTFAMNRGANCSAILTLTNPRKGGIEPGLWGSKSNMIRIQMGTDT